jgi:hypothetical protein
MKNVVNLEEYRQKRDLEQSKPRLTRLPAQLVNNDEVRVVERTHANALLYGSIFEFVMRAELSGQMFSTEDQLAFDTKMSQLESSLPPLLIDDIQTKIFSQIAASAS